MSESGSTNTALMEEGDAHAIAQAIYHAVTDKTEKLNRSFNENYRITESDIEQLHAKCTQMCSQWTVLETNQNITIQHLDDNNQNFSSIERFRIYDKSQTSAVEALTYEFNFLLSLPNSKKPQPYKVTARVISPIALMNRMESSLAPPKILRYFRDGPIVIEVEYVDYVVARNIMSTLESWVNEVKHSEKNNTLKFFQKYSHWIPRVGGAGLLLLAVAASFVSAGTELAPDSGDQALAKFLIIAAGFTAFSLIAGTWLGRFAENAIDQLQELSYIKLNKGDEKLIDKFGKKNLFSCAGTGISVLLISAHAVACGLAASFLYAQLLP